MNAAPSPLKAAIVEASSSHLDALAELQLELIKYMAELIPAGFGQSLQELPSIEEVKSTFIEAIDDPNTCLLVAEVEQHTAGYIMGVVEEYTDDLITAPFLTVQYLGVRKEYRRCGLAALLMGEMESFAKSRGIRRIDLLVWENNPGAKALFGKLGYIALEHRLAKVI